MNQKIFTVKLRMSNAYLIKEKGCILVDAGCPGEEGKIVKLLSEIDCKLADIKLIVITHGHTDHFGSAASIRAFTQAKIAVHNRDLDLVRDGTNGKLIGTGPIGNLLAMYLNRKKVPPIQGLEPDLQLCDKFDLTSFGIEGQIIATPGHTPGGVSIILKSGEAIVGDNIMSLGSNKRPAYPLFASEYAQLRESINRLMDYRPTILYSGHGGPFFPEQIKNLHSGLLRGIV